MSTQDSYADRHLMKQNPQHRSLSKPHKENTSQHTALSSTSASIQSAFLGELHSKASKIELQALTEKVTDMDSKIANLTNIVRLVQKYTEAQDIQYEKEKQMMAGRQGVLTTLIAEYEKRVQQEDRRVAEISQLCGSFREQLEKGRGKSTEHRSHSGVEQQQLSQMLQSREDKLRKEMNRKVEVCMNEIQGLPSREELTKIVANSDTLRHQVQFEIQRLESIISKVNSGRELKPILKTQANSVDRPRSASKSKYVQAQEFAQFKEDTDRRFTSIIDKFEKVSIFIVKKYVGGRSVTPPLKTEGHRSVSKRTEPDIIFNQKSTVRRQDQPRHPRIVNEENIRISEYSRGRSKPKAGSSKTLSKHNKSQEKQQVKQSRNERSRSVSRKSSQSSNNLKAIGGVVQRRKIKQDQLKQMIKKSKKVVSSAALPKKTTKG